MAKLPCMLYVLYVKIRGAEVCEMTSSYRWR